MKKIFLSILITFLAGIAVLLGFSFIKRTDYVAKSHSSTEVNKTWKVALANYVNENGISLSVDGEVLEDVKSEAAFMADDMELMMEKKAVTDLFGCAVNLYDDSVLTIARGETEVQVSVNDRPVLFGAVREEIVAAAEADGQRKQDGHDRNDDFFHARYLRKNGRRNAAFVAFSMPYFHRENNRNQRNIPEGKNVWMFVFLQQPNINFTDDEIKEADNSQLTLLRCFYLQLTAPLS